MKELSKIKEIKEIDKALYNTIQTIIDDSVDQYIESHNYIVVKTRKVTTSCSLELIELIELNKLIIEVLEPMDYDMHKFVNSDLMIDYIKSRIKREHNSDGRFALKFFGAITTYGASIAIDMALKAKFKKATKLLNDNKNNRLGNYDAYKKVYDFFKEN